MKQYQLTFIFAFILGWSCRGLYYVIKKKIIKFLHNRKNVKDSQMWEKHIQEKYKVSKDFLGPFEED